MRQLALTPFRVGKLEVPITVSIGGSEFDGCTCRKKVSIESLLHLADECLYQSKRDGRNRVTLKRLTIL